MERFEINLYRQVDTETIRVYDSLMIITGDTINQAQHAALIAGLKLEKIGLRKKGPSSLSIAKKQFGIKAKTAADALPQVLAIYAETYGREYGA